jgi:maltooligosyltrehalose trehalohydrolase
MLGERLNTLVDFEMFKLLAGSLFISPFIPLIFMGEEYGEKNPFLYFNSHGDPELIRKVREGRKNEFREFYERGEPAEAQDLTTFLHSKLSWNYQTDGQDCDLLRYYKFWIRLRKENPVLRSLDRKDINLKILEGTNTILIERSHGNHRLSGILNFGSDPLIIPPSAMNVEDMKMCLNSSSALWGGPFPENESKSKGNGVNVKGHSIMIFTN